MKFRYYIIDLIGLLLILSSPFGCSYVLWHNENPDGWYEASTVFASIGIMFYGLYLGFVVKHATSKEKKNDINTD